MYNILRFFHHFFLTVKKIKLNWTAFFLFQTNYFPPFLKFCFLFLTYMLLVVLYRRLLKKKCANFFLILRKYMIVNLKQFSVDTLVDDVAKYTFFYTTQILLRYGFRKSTVIGDFL